MDTLNLPQDDVFSLPRAGRPKTARKAPARSGRAHAGPTIGPGELTPPSSGSQLEREAPQMLMSPPPEEILRVCVLL